MMRSNLNDGDHPRVCGEHQHTVMNAGRGWGSSPRMRGALMDAKTAIDGMGIIPAYAGSTHWKEQLRLW